MSKHLQRVDARYRAGRFVVIAFVWVAGLVSGGYALLSIAVRYGCSANDKGLACTGSGSAVGTFLVLAVIAVVTAVTALALNRPPRLLALFGVGGLILLAVCFAGARALLNTT